MGNTIYAVLAVAGLLVTFVLIVGLWVSRYFKAGPNEALVISGKGGQKVITGGAMFVPPVLYKISRMSLEANNVSVQQKNIYTRDQIPININGVLVYKIKGDQDSVLKASQSLQNKNTQEIENLVQSVAEGSFRDICGKMSPEEINGDREAFQRRVAEVANAHYSELGIELVTFTVQHISDDTGYFTNLGVPRAATVQKEARQKKAEADRMASVVEVEQKRDSEMRTAQTQTEIFEAQKIKDVSKAKYDAEVSEERAKSSMAGPKAEAKAKQEVVEQQTLLAEREAQKREKELQSELIKPAEAQKTSTILNAEANKAQTILKAESEAETTRIIGVAEGDAAKAKGLGEAEAIKAKLFAEADGLYKKAEAMKQFNDATTKLEIAKEIIHILPELAKALMEPVGNIKDIKIIDFGGNGNNPNGNSSPIGRLLDISPTALAKLDETLKATIGIDLKDTMQLIRKGDITDNNKEVGS